MPRTLAELPGVTILAEDENGKIVSAISAGAPELTAAQANLFAKGCNMIDTSRGLTFANTALVSDTPVWKNIQQGDALAPVASATISDTGNTDCYVVAPVTGYLTGVEVSGATALAADDTNYVTWTIKNLNKGFVAPTDMLAADALNTTQLTGGQALPENEKIDLVLSGTTENLYCDAGDRLLIRAAATGTLANTVAAPVYKLSFAAAR